MLIARMLEKEKVDWNNSVTIWCIQERVQRLDKYLFQNFCKTLPTFSTTDTTNLGFLYMQISNLGTCHILIGPLCSLK